MFRRSQALCSLGAVAIVLIAAAPAAPNPVAAASPAPGASPGPNGQRRAGGGGPTGGNAFYYTPSIGLFVVRAPDLGTGGGSVKQ